VESALIDIASMNTCLLLENQFLHLQGKGKIGLFFLMGGGRKSGYFNRTFTILGFTFKKIWNTMVFHIFYSKKYCSIF